MANCREYYDETSRLLKRMHDGVLASDDAKRLHKLLGQWENVDCPNNGADCVRGKCPYAETPEWITAHGFTNLRAMVIDMGFKQVSEGRKFERIPQSGCADPAAVDKGKRMWAADHGERVYRKSLLVGIAYLIGGVAGFAAALWIGRGFFEPEVEWFETGIGFVIALGAGILFVMGGADAVLDRKPVLIIGNRGVMTREYRLILWNEIAYARGLSAKSTHVFITLRDPVQFARKHNTKILCIELEVPFDGVTGDEQDAAALISARAAGPAQKD